MNNSLHNLQTSSLIKKKNIIISSLLLSFFFFGIQAPTNFVKASQIPEINRKMNLIAIRFVSCKLFIAF